MKAKYLVTYSWLLATLVVLTRVAPAASQEAERDTTEVIPLRGVSVTVLRTPLEISRAPYAVTIKASDNITRAKPEIGLDEAFRGVTGVQVDNRFNYALGERISIRGFGARSQFGVRGIRVLVDGIPATFPDGQTSLSHVDLGLLDRTEVIRGPASALYGNTAGGVLQLETESPPLVGSSQDVGLIVGDHGLLKLSGGATGRSGSLGYLLNISRLEYGGFREFSSAENLRLNAKLRWSGNASELQITGSAVGYDARNPGSLSAELLAEDRFQAYSFNRAQQTGEEGRQGQLGALWRRTMGAGEIELAAYGISRRVTNPIPTTIIELDRSVGGLRALFRSNTSSPAALRWTGGIDADIQLDHRQNYGNTRGERAHLTLDQSERVLNLAGFGQAAAVVTERILFLAGLRYDLFRFSADDRFVAADNPDDSGERLMSSLSPSAGISFTFGQPLTLYSNVATAFETPTTTELTNRPSGAGGFNPDLEPQKALSIEFGGRGHLGGWLTYEAAVFRANVRNALISFQVPGAGGRDFFRNAGSTLHRGLELSATAATARGAHLQAAYSYIDARFDEYSSGGDVFDGNRVPGVSPHRLELIASYERPDVGFVAVESRYVAGMPVDDANAFSSPSYALIDVNAEAERVRLGGMDISPFVGVTNLFDRAYNTSVTVNAFGGRYYEPGPGRALYGGATLRVRR